MHLLRKELIELRADPRLFGIVIMAPIIQLCVLGYAATTDVQDVPLLVVDGDRSEASRRLVSRFDASANFVHRGRDRRPRRSGALSRARGRVDGPDHSRRPSATTSPPAGPAPCR